MSDLSQWLLEHPELNLPGEALQVQSGGETGTATGADGGPKDVAPTGEGPNVLVIVAVAVAVLVAVIVAWRSFRATPADTQPDEPAPPKTRTGDKPGADASDDRPSKDILEKRQVVKEASTIEDDDSLATIKQKKMEKVEKTYEEAREELRKRNSHRVKRQQQAKMAEEEAAEAQQESSDDDAADDGSTADEAAASEAATEEAATEEAAADASDAEQAQAASEDAADEGAQSDEAQAVAAEGGEAVAEGADAQNEEAATEEADAKADAEPADEAGQEAQEDEAPSAADVAGDNDDVPSPLDGLSLGADDVDSGWGDMDFGNFDLSGADDLGASLSDSLGAIQEAVEASGDEAAEPEAAESEAAEPEAAEPEAAKEEPKAQAEPKEEPAKPAAKEPAEPKEEPKAAAEEPKAEAKTEAKAPEVKEAAKPKKDAEAAKEEPAKPKKTKKAEPKRPKKALPESLPRSQRSREPSTDRKSLADGLQKTRGGFISRLGQLFKNQSEIDEDLMDELEEVLYTSDIGAKSVEYLLNRVRTDMDENSVTDPKRVWQYIRETTETMLTEYESPLKIDSKPGQPFVLLVVGVNGVGKTTTIGKLAMRFTDAGHSVLMVAGDTFRAAATEQLEEWGARTNLEVHTGADKADPASVIYSGIERGINEEFDVVICDTAGRLTNKKNLMKELEKIGRVAGKVLDGAPHETLLVLDANTGRMAVQQARLFQEVVDITGLVLTKLDGTAKGGVIIGISRELKVPVRYIGIGEGVYDLRPFDAQEFVEALFM